MKFGVKESWKFIEAPTRSYIKNHPEEFVGKGVRIGETDETLYQTLEQARDDYNKIHGITVIDGVRHHSR